MPTTKRTAQIVAVGIEICCPYCGERVPNEYTGADWWTIEEAQKFGKDNKEHTCNSCDRLFALGMHKTAQIVY